ncbi:carbohydrate sulfotransferase 12-like [Nerophis lumbriciformis]|uniref:carbohydrate sulfotransferase 12-like n=1 Tax=Nerophis lumbriciformis TaxID=546530 RepID=UPI002ADFB9BA|nr:carbohydrate sulfotransferase 12-like [Nerophis lumbriciformis]
MSPAIGFPATDMDDMEEGTWEVLKAMEAEMLRHSPMERRDLRWGPNGKLVPISSVWPGNVDASLLCRKRRQRQKQSRKASTSRQEASLPPAPPPPDRLGRVVREQELRKTVLRDACRENMEAFPQDKQSSDKHIKTVLHQLLVDDEHGFIYCFIPKVACTNWKRFMHALKEGEPYPDLMSIPCSKANNPKGLPSLASFSKVEMEAKLKHYTKFMFVREPLVRLISAFRNKLLSLNQFYYQGLGRLLLRRYGNLSDPPLTVKEAVASGIQPTFYHFVQHLLNSTSHMSDYHWKQFYRLCQPCYIEYDFIGHQETLDEDALEVLTSLNVEKLIKFPPAYQNATSPATLSKWLKEVPLEDRRKLYELYKKDYQLFGYEPPYTLLNITQ